MAAGRPASSGLKGGPLARSELSDEDVRTAIKNSGGVKGSLLIPEAPFELLVGAPPLIWCSLLQRNLTPDQTRGL